MADLAAADVVYTVQNRQRALGAGGGRNRNRVKIAFGDGALTYPSGGVPLTKGKLGCPRYLESVTLFDADDGSGIVWKYDAENEKLRGYIEGIVVSAAGGATMDDFALDTTAEPLATAVSVSLTNSTGAGTKYLGKLIELGNVAIAAQTLYVEAVGH